MGRFLVLSMLTVFTALATSTGCSAARADRPAGGPLLIELFTSQGCSSCPPADKLLGELGSDPRVIPLAFHVDYWDQLGWKDPFSSPDWSQRQADYARVLRGRGIYTPEIVAGGVAETVGSSRDRVLALVGAAGPSPVQVTASAELTGGALRVSAAATPPPGPDAVLMVAVTESGIATEVARGENAGRRLVNDHVVRRLLAVPAGGVVTVPLDAAWSPSHLGAAAFVQERRTLRVLGAARAAYRRID